MDESRSRSVKFTDNEFATIERAAERAGKSPHAWMRDVLLAASGRSKFGEQIASFDAGFSMPAGLSPAFDELRGVEGKNDADCNPFNWIFVFRDPQGRAVSLFGHIRETSTAFVRLEIWCADGRAVLIPRASIIAWQKLNGSDAHSPGPELWRWQLWGARLHERAQNIDRKIQRLLPPWSDEPTPRKLK